MAYTITVMYGDYSFANQPHWHQRYTSVADAKADARASHEHFLARLGDEDNSCLYTVIMEEDEDIFVNWLLWNDKVYLDDEATAKAEELSLSSPE